MSLINTYINYKFIGQSVKEKKRDVETLYLLQFITNIHSLSACAHNLKISLKWQYVLDPGTSCRQNHLHIFSQISKKCIVLLLFKLAQPNWVSYRFQDLFNMYLFSIYCQMLRQLQTYVTSLMLCYILILQIWINGSEEKIFWEFWKKKLFQNWPTTNVLGQKWICPKLSVHCYNYVKPPINIIKCEHETLFLFQQLSLFKNIYGIRRITILDPSQSSNTIMIITAHW